MFTEVLIIWDLSEWKLWLPLFALNIGMFIVSYVVVWVCSMIFKIKKTAFNLLVCLMSFPNTGALPLIFIGALKGAFVNEGKKTGDTTNYNETFDKAVGFIMLNACIQTILRWSIGYDMMRKPEYLVEQEREEEVQPLRVRKAATEDGPSEFMLKVKEIMNPTLIASIIAIVIASIPAAKAVFYQKDAVAPLYDLIFYPLYVIGANGKSIMTIQLGCNLAMIMDEKISDEKELLGTKDYALSVILKNILFPFIGLAVVLPLLSVGFMHDEMQSFVAMLQIASPSAITLSVITNIHKFLERETAK